MAEADTYFELFLAHRAELVRYASAASRIENRVGEPAANPYLYLASQIVSGLDGLARRADPGPSADAPYATPAPHLPRTLDEAVSALASSTVFREGFGDSFVDYLIRGHRYGPIVMTGRIVRLAERGRREIRFQLDGRDAVALEGDTVLIAVLANADHVRRSEFGAQEPRAAAHRRHPAGCGTLPSVRGSSGHPAQPAARRFRQRRRREDRR